MLETEKVYAILMMWGKDHKRLLELKPRIDARFKYFSKKAQEKVREEKDNVDF